MNLAKNSDYAALRVHVLQNAKTVVIKVGSAVLTGESGLNRQVLDSLAWQIGEIRNRYQKEHSGQVRRVILVSSGAVAAGKAALLSGGVSCFSNYAIARHAIAAVGQSRLMQAWNESFEPHGIITAQVLFTREDLRSRARFQTAADTFAQMLAWEVLPIVNENDTVSSGNLKFGDNDCLASLLVNLVEAELFVNLTSAPGVLAENPETNPDARVLEYVESINKLDLESLCGAKTSVGSGGMHSKLLAARRVCQLGVPTLILPGREKNILLDAFYPAISDHQKIGTWICPAEKSIPRRKFWLAYQSEPAGAVEIDDGAARALLYEGRSLLPGGVVKISGEFDKGALLRVAHSGHNLGVGFSNYAAHELAKIIGLKRHEVAAILGNPRYPDVIHRDNLLLDAAI